MNDDTKKNNFHFKKFIKIFLFLFLFFLIVFYLYIRYVEPKMIQVHEIAFSDQSLPNEFNGFKIVHFSDIHYGSSINKQSLEKIVKKINALHPDVIVYTGDLFDDSIVLRDEDIQDLKELMKNINASIKKYAVVGNSDYINKEMYLEIMRDTDFKVLENENDFLYYKGNTPILFIGTTSMLEHEMDIDKASTLDNNDIEYFKIWVHHEPAILDSILEKDLHPNLLLTGHSLGGLASLPFYGNVLKQDGISKYTQSYYFKKNISMYVSNGLGTYKYPIRFMNVPSINFYRLYNH